MRQLPVLALAVVPCMFRIMAAQDPNPRIKRQARPGRKSSKSVQSFGVAWVFGLERCTDIRRRPILLLPRPRTRRACASTPNVCVRPGRVRWP
jgi:hypothetical protein